jgi:hypothetical protein
MTVSQLVQSPETLPESPRGTRSPSGRGHDHFWERATSRGVFVRRAAAAAGATLTAGTWFPGLARAAHGDRHKAVADPRPIPPNPTLGGFHIQVPAENSEPSTIFDFTGFVGIAEIGGTGTARMPDGSRSRLFFDVDNRFMTGVYVGLDGRVHHGTFAFT